MQFYSMPSLSLTVARQVRAGTRRRITASLYLRYPNFRTPVPDALESTVRPSIYTVPAAFTATESISRRLACPPRDAEMQGGADARRTWPLL